MHQNIPISTIFDTADLLAFWKDFRESERGALGVNFYRHSIVFFCSLRYMCDLLLAIGFTAGIAALFRAAVEIVVKNARYQIRHIFCSILLDTCSRNLFFFIKVRDFIMSRLKIWQVNVLSNIILKISNLADFYQRQVVNCMDSVCASFLDYVADQKRQQVEMLQNITGIRGENILAESKTGSREHGDMLENLGNKGLDELFEYIKNLSVRDLKMYSILSNEDKVSRSVFLSLIDSEEAFMAQLDFGYLDLLSNVQDKVQLTTACR